MTPINNVTGNVNPLGNQAATQKKATHSTESSKEKTERVETVREASAGEVQTDTVEITSNRAPWFLSKPRPERFCLSLSNDQLRQC